MKKGFTLIELLAVIVILAIIALIATPIVLNIINESKEGVQLRSAEMYLKGIETSIATAKINNKNITDGTFLIMSNGNICIKNKTDDTCSEELKVEMNGEKPKSGSIIITKGIIKYISLSYSNGKTIIKNTTENLKYRTSSCTLVVDKDENDTVSINDEIECAGEYFYVIPQDTTNHESANDSTVTLFTKKNITVDLTKPKQSDNAGTVPFSSSYYFSAANSNQYIYDENQDGIGNYLKAYKKYLIDLGVNVLGIELLSSSQINDLGCSSGSWYCIFKLEGDPGNGTAEQFVYSTNYWMGFPAPSMVNPGGVYYMTTNGWYSETIYSETNISGIRPVIIINKSEISK